MVTGALLTYRTDSRADTTTTKQMSLTACVLDLIEDYIDGGEGTEIDRMPNQKKQQQQHNVREFYENQKENIE